MKGTETGANDFHSDSISLLLSTTWNSSALNEVLSQEVYLVIAKIISITPPFGAARLHSKGANGYQCNDPVDSFHLHVGLQGAGRQLLRCFNYQSCQSKHQSLTATPYETVVHQLLSQLNVVGLSLEGK